METFEAWVAAMAARHCEHDPGVKMIGATSHYVTETLDAGPIIEQDLQRVSHPHSIKDLIRFGRDLEKDVLSLTPVPYLASVAMLWSPT